MRMGVRMLGRRGGRERGEGNARTVVTYHFVIWI